MKWQDFIDSHPGICHGQPCFKVNGSLTRIMAYLVLELLEAEISPEEIIRDYYPQITKDHIKAVLDFSACLLKSEEYLLPASA